MGANGPQCTGPGVCERGRPPHMSVSSSTYRAARGSQGGQEVAVTFPQGRLAPTCQDTGPHESPCILTGSTERSPVHRGPQPGAGAVRGCWGHLFQRDLGAEESRVLLPGEWPTLPWVGCSGRPLADGTGGGQRPPPGGRACRAHASLPSGVAWGGLDPQPSLEVQRQEGLGAAGALG